MIGYNELRRSKKINYSDSIMAIMWLWEFFLASLSRMLFASHVCDKDFCAIIKFSLRKIGVFRLLLSFNTFYLSSGFSCVRRSFFWCDFAQSLCALAARQRYEIKILFWTFEASQRLRKKSFMWVAGDCNQDLLVGRFSWRSDCK